MTLPELLADQVQGLSCLVRRCGRSGEENQQFCFYMPRLRDFLDIQVEILSKLVDMF